MSNYTLLIPQRFRISTEWVYRFRRKYRADSESRREESTSEIELSEEALIKIIKKFENPDIHLFTSRVNAKCEKFASWKNDPESMAIDEFTISWKPHYFHAFPTCPIILKTLQKIRFEKRSGIIVVPEWHAPPLYRLFCAILVSDPLQLKANDNIYFSDRNHNIFWQKVTLTVKILSENRLNFITIETTKSSLSKLSFKQFEPERVIYRNVKKPFRI